jgi:hypothetical protein
VPGQAATDAHVALLSQLIDHAPMFPPAELVLEEALADHAAARRSDAGWMINRFVLPASALDQLPADAPLRLSIVRQEGSPRTGLDDPRIEALEVAGSFQVATQPGSRLEVYVEGLPPRAFAPLAKRRVRAKIRCGGARVPTAAELAEFVQECRRLRLPFKATAGLHHAVRSDAEHGFLNLLAAVVFGDEEEALEERDPSAFELDSDSFRWRDRAADAGQLRAVRRDLFVSIGSCSFFEPVGELRGLGMLPA